jgi:hypothetical protein
MLGAEGLRGFPVYKGHSCVRYLSDGEEANVSTKDRIRDLCNQLLRAESPIVIQFVASHLQKAIAEFAIENAQTAELTPLPADLPSTTVCSDAKDLTAV